MGASLRLGLAGVAALVLALPRTSLAGDTSMYVVAKGGAWIPDANPGWTVGSESGRLPVSGLLEVAVGLREGILGLQVAAGYTWSSVTSARPGGTPLQLTTGSVPFLAAGQFRLPFPVVEPYLELGLGGIATFGTLTAPGVGGTATASADGLTLLCVLGAGVDVFLDRFLVGVEVRQFYVLGETHPWGSLGLSALAVTLNAGYVLF